MRIFVLEDDPGRIAWFRKRFVGHDVTYADSCTQVDRYVPPYDLVCFDHDLGGRQMEEHEDDGNAFAIAIRDSILGQIPNQPIVVIHSFNSEGAYKIQATLDRRAYRAPFLSFLFKTVLDIALLEDGALCQ